MKKYYTLLAAAAVAVSASAMPVAQKALHVSEAASASKAISTVETRGSDFVSERAMPSVGSFAGTYFLNYTLTYTGGSETGMIPFTIEATSQANVYTLKEFMFSDANDITAVIVEENGSYFMAIPAGQELFVNQGKSYKLYPGYSIPEKGWGADFSEGDDALIEFVWQDGCFVPGFGFQTVDSKYVGLAYATPVGDSYSGNVFTNVAMYMANATFDATVSNGQTEQPYQDELYCGKIINGRTGKITGVNVYGIGGLSNPLTLTYQSDGSLLAKDCVAGEFYVAQGSQETATAYFTNAELVNDKFASTTVTASTTTAAGKTSIDFGEYLCVYMPTKDALVGAFFAPKVNCNFAIEFGAAGIENVAVDAENAPVEYFNIQGQRVANPAAGQLVIRRQGTQVSKVIF